MKEILENSRKLVTSNIKCDLDEKTIDILVAATTAILLRKPETALEKLPAIFSRLNVIADENRTTLEIAHEELGDYTNDHKHSNCYACVVRVINGDTENMDYTEDKTLILSLKKANESAPALIEKATHELYHLLRSKGIEKNGRSLKIKDGISTVYYNVDKKSMLRKHEQFEEGIVQRYTNESLKLLYENIKNCNVGKHSLLGNFKRKFNTYHSDAYYPHTLLLDELCTDLDFSILMDYTFSEEETPSKLITYYNNVMGSSTAFTALSKSLNDCYDGFCDDDIMKCGDNYSDLMLTARDFLIKAHSFQHKK